MCFYQGGGAFTPATCLCCHQSPVLKEHWGKPRGLCFRFTDVVSAPQSQPTASSKGVAETYLSNQKQLLTQQSTSAETILSQL